MTRTNSNISLLSMLEEENRQLRKEIDALYSASQIKEEQLLVVTRAMDEIVLEMEAQRNDLRSKNKELRELNAYIRSINDTMDNLLLVADLSGRVTQINRAFSEHLGWQENELEDLQLDSLLPKTERKQIRKQLPRNAEGSFLLGAYLQRHGHFEKETSLINHLGQETDVVYWAKGELLYSHQGKLQGMLLTATDISILKQREQALEESQQALQKAKAEADFANRAKGNFLASISHEIRTPLNAVNGYAQLLLHTPLTPKQQDYLSRLNIASHSLVCLINDVLDLSKIEAGKLQPESIPFLIDEVLNNVIHMMELDASRKGIYLRCQRHPSIPDCLKGDPMRLQQVLVNLINNAVKFTGEGGVIVNVALGETPEMVDFSVIDTGVGMTQEQKTELFTMYQQGENSTFRRHGGTGLGLTICQHLVALMGGDIKIESQAQHGVTVHFSLPLVLPVETGNTGLIGELPIFSRSILDKQPPPQPEMSPFNGWRVLVVDDNAINRDMLAELLADYGVKTEKAACGEQAIKKLSLMGSSSNSTSNSSPGSSPKESYNLVLMDICMEGMDGLETTRHIRSLEGMGELPVIAVTADTMVTDKALWQSAGIDDYVSKPVDIGALLRVMGQWLNKPVSISEEPHQEAVLHFAPAKALKRMGENRRVLQKMITQFIAMAPKILSDITELNQLSIGDPTQQAKLHGKLHELKGVSAIMELAVLHKQVQVLMDWQKCHKKPFSPQQIHDLDVAFGETLPELERYIANT